MTPSDPCKFAPPPVFATAADLARLRGYVRAAPFGGDGVELLISELARMRPRPETDAGFVRLNHGFRYKDLRTKRERQARIVAPDAADPDAAKISVLSPLGAALIGLPAGAILRWRDADGAVRAVKVVETDAPAA